MRKFELILIVWSALVALVIILFLLCEPTNAGDWKSCIIKYKTDAGLCWQIEDVLNVVDTTIIRDADTTVCYPMGKSMWEFDSERDYSKEAGCDYKKYSDSMLVICHRRVVTLRLFRGLTIIDWPLGWYSDYYVSDSTAYGKAILIFEEVEK